MRLLLDLGNTRLKWAMLQQGEVGTHGALAWEQCSAEHLAQAWAGCARPGAVFAASVVDASRESQLAESLTRAFGRNVFWLRTPALACGVRNAYAEPQRLGVDRFLAMVAAHADQSGPCILVSVGTALTLDALAADGTHLGGLIAPGPRLMQQSLLGATAQVRPDRDGVILELANNTADAVASGCWQAAAALVDRFFTRTKSQLGADASLLLDGGDAGTLQPLLSESAILTRDAVLRGLAVWSQMHMAHPLAD